MSHSNRKHVWTVGSVLLSATLGVAATTALADDSATTKPSLETVDAQLQAKVNSLEARMSAMEGNQSQTQADTAAAIQEVIKNADHDSQFLTDQPAPLTSGYAPSLGFVIRSDDGIFTMHPGLVLDIRNMTDYRQDIVHGGGGTAAPATGYDTQNGFELSRMRFTLDGQYTENLTYFFQLSADQGNPLSLLDAYVTYRLGTDSPWAIKAGQFKDPVWHERNISEANLLAVDRSFVEDLLGGGQGSRIQGASLIFNQDAFRGQLVFHDGFNSQNTNFVDAGGVGAGVTGAAGVTPTNYGASTRVEYMLIGNRTPDFNPYTEYDQFTALSARQDILVIGGGVDFSEGGSNDLLLHSLDIQYDSTWGLGLYAAYLGAYRDLHANQGVAPGYYYDPGFEAQASFLVSSNIEPFARYDYTHLDPSSVTGLSSRLAQEITIGANYYIHNQNVKLTLDASWLPDGSPVDADALGILKNSGENEFVLRAQLQLAL